MRQVLVQGTRSDKSRTSVSVHSTLWAIAERHYKGRDQLLKAVRGYIREDMDSWAVSAQLMVQIARPSLTNGQLYIED